MIWTKSLFLYLSQGKLNTDKAHPPGYISPHKTLEFFKTQVSDLCFHFGGSTLYCIKYIKGTHILYLVYFLLFMAFKLF